jgi:hypothetical protein
LTMRIRKTCSIAHEAADNGIGLVGMACRDRMARRQRDE